MSVPVTHLVALVRIAGAVQLAIVAANFVIQGGGFNTDYTPKAAPAKVPNESGNGLSNVRTTVGLARTSDPHGGNAQFNGATGTAIRRKK